MSDTIDRINRLGLARKHRDFILSLPEPERTDELMKTEAAIAQARIDDMIDQAAVDLALMCAAQSDALEAGW